jgi:hypothetical protein
VSISASSGGIVARDAQGHIWTWGSPALTNAAVPAGVTGAPISELAPGAGAVFALTPAVIALDKPTITGTGAVGRELDATDATFSGLGAALVTGRWYINGVPVGATRSGGGTTGSAPGSFIVPTAGDTGKVITYRTTAVDPQTGASVVVESNPITVGGRVASTVTVTAHSGSYGHSSSITVRVASPTGASGAVTLSLDGADAGTAALTHGSATFRLPAKLSAGFHMVGASYGGNSVTGGATGWATLNISKGTSHTKVTLPKKAHHGGKVKVTVKVRTSGGRATGTVSVKIGKAKGYASVVHGKAVVRLKVAKVPHKQKVVAIYSGDNNVRGSRAHTRLTVR